MSATYTRELWAVTSGGAGTVPGPGPAAGFRWVVVDVAAQNPTAIAEAWLSGFTLEDNVGYPIMGVSQNDARGQITYHWSGRQVIDNPHQLQANFAEAGWLLRVTGFELSLP